VGRHINVGCGQYPIQSPFENYDINVTSPAASHAGRPVLYGDAFKLDYAGAELVFAGHFLEHQTPEDAHRFIRLVRQQAPAAALVLVVPVLDRCNHPSVDFKLLQQIVSHYTVYPDAAPGIAHRSWWRTRDVISAVQDAGYGHVSEWPDCPWLVARVDWQVVLRASA